MAQSRSLASLYPRRWYVPLGLAAAMGLLVATMTIERNQCPARKRLAAPSMMFVVAVTIVLASSKAALDASPRAGLYVFTAAVVLWMFMTLELERLARRSQSQGG
jgi:hypothetical protein